MRLSTLILLAVAGVECVYSSPSRRPQGFPSRRSLNKRQGNTFDASNPALNDPTVQIADASVGTGIASGYQGPMASDLDRAMVGPVNLLRSGPVRFGAKPNLTIPVYAGLSESGKNYWWIVTDTSDEGNAAVLGLNFSPKLRFAAQSGRENGTKAAEQLEVINNTVWKRRGLVDFSPVRTVLPGNGSAFPPSTFRAGSKGDEEYTPLVQLTNAGYEVWNAPIIAGDVDEEYLNQFCDGVPEDKREDFYSKVHDQVLAICPREQLVTLATIRGFSFSKSVLYLVSDSADELPAALDGATWAPRLTSILTGQDDAIFSSVERIFVVTNGFTNADLPAGAPQNATNHPWRQGLDSAIMGEGDPLNVLGAIPTVAGDYSPLWNFNLYTWTDFAVTNGIRTRLTGEFEVLGMAAAGYVTNPDGEPLSDSGFINNCPIVHRFL